MIELRVSVSEVDYEAVIQALAGRLTGPAAMAVTAMRAMPDSAKEELLVKYLNASAGHIERQLENAAQAKGVRLKVSGASASVAQR